MTTDIYKASYDNDVEVLRAALRAGANPNEPHPTAGTLPLLLACQANALEAMRELLGSGANADAVFTFVSRVSGRVVAGRTALMYVESCEAALLLLDAGADINRVDSMGWSALVHAAHGASADLVQLLISKGADIAVTPLYDGRNLTLAGFVQARCSFLEENARALRQPEASASLDALREVGDLVERASHT